MMSRAKLLALPFLVLSIAQLPMTAAAAKTETTTAETVAEADAAAEAMVESWNIVQNATTSPEHKTLIKAISAAGLVETLSGAGPFTVFAPTDQAFAAVPSMTEYLMHPLNTEKLAKVLTYHVVLGRITAEDIYKRIETGGGTATLTTVEGETLTFTEVQGNIKIDGTQGSTGFVTQADVAQSNGMMHVINGVLLPTIG